MADVDIDPCGEHESRPDDHTDTGENISLIPGGPEGTPHGGGSTWEPERGEQKTSFRGREAQRTKLMKDLYKKYQKTLVKPQNHFTTIILNSKVGDYTI